MVKRVVQQCIGLTLISLVGLNIFSLSASAIGASLSITPSSGVYEVGGTVDVSFLVDTGGQTINAVQADITFPADKLQVVNPVASTSFISQWAPMGSTYSNTDGTIHFAGGLPTPGIKTSGGVISTVTFRIKSAGSATIRFASTSRVLLNDGAGTNILSSTGTASITLKTPPPAGPSVSSPTHPETNVWYNNPQVQFQWDAVDGASGYGYVFDQSPNTVPPEAIVTTATAASVKATSDGVWYFHVRAKTDAWGGVTTLQVQIDATPPAAFKPSFDATTITVNDTPTLRFVTTDAASGIDHFEIKQMALSTSSDQSVLFIETSSPYTPGKLLAGSYTYIVRAFDRAGNSVDANAKITVIAAGLPFYARVPFLQNPAVANIALILLGLIAIILIGILIVRHFRLRSTFERDLSVLERNAQRKSHALERELTELRRVQGFANQKFGAWPSTTESAPPASSMPSQQPPQTPPQP